MNCGIYIHIPYCIKKCPYCDFYSVIYDDCSASEYTDAVISVIQSYKGRRADTLYFGGGTPNLMGAERIGKMISAAKACFGLSADAEITLEANPESLRRQDISAFKKAGVNRLSMGLQSANENELSSLGRRHTNEDVVYCVREAKKAGIDNISLDLMLGTQGQSKASLLNSIEFCAALNVSHISAYMLKIEPNTPFYKKRALLDLPDDDEAAELYLFAVNELERRGYKQYEISNFARDGAVSRHNTKYWRGEEYVGIGAAAHGFENGERYYYGRSVKDFIASPLSRTSDGEGGGFDEFFMLNMRLCEGVSLSELAQKFGAALPQSFYSKIENFAKAGLIIKSGGRISFTPKGFLISNSIISDLLYVLESYD
ncbi:MAG: radical SAM family heme chaperone HemW [Oscillospiraceae bacterium]|nr:radical SAM family heme chaperone HemW [Oscillospiraceae bacterium]